MATDPHGAAPPDSLDVALNALQRLLDMYRAERIIYAIGAAAGTALLMYAAFLAIRGGEQNREALGYFFGAGGFFSISGGLTLRLFDKSFDLIREIIRARIQGGG